MKYKNCAYVKDQMQFSPTLPMKTKGNTANSNIDWVEPTRKKGLKADCGITGDLYSNNDTEILRPQHDPENNFVAYARVNEKYDPSIDMAVCKDGFRPHQFDPLENEYTDQHKTIFYDSVTEKDKITGKKVTGMLERGNFLDRI